MTDSTQEPKRPDPCLDCTFQGKIDCHKDCMIPNWLRDVIYLPDDAESLGRLWAAVETFPEVNEVSFGGAPKK